MVVWSLQSRKADSPENLSHEHFKFGGIITARSLSTIFNAILFPHRIPATS